MPEITPSELIDGVFIVDPALFGDDRGFFVETYRREWFPGGREMIQANRGDRGPAASWACTTTCTRPTTGTCPSAVPAWCCTTCAGEPHRRRHAVLDLGEVDGGPNQHRGVYIPPGVAHGFASLTDMTITYLVDGYYNPADELGVAWDDPAIGADWGVTDPILSDRDRQNPPRADIEPMWQAHSSLRT